VRPRRIVNCLIAPPRNILTYLLTYLLSICVQWLHCTQIEKRVTWPKPRPFRGDGTCQCVSVH